MSDEQRLNNLGIYVSPDDPDYSLKVMEKLMEKQQELNSRQYTLAEREKLPQSSLPTTQQEEK